MNGTHDVSSTPPAAGDDHFEPGDAAALLPTSGRAPP